MKSKGQKFALVSAVALLALCCVLAVPISARAEESTVYKEKYIGYSVDADGNELSRNSLKDATNTVHINTNGLFETGRTSTGEVVEESAPKITVLTHGYNSRASDWSNDFEYKDVPHNDQLNFAYDPNSLVEKLRAAGGDAKIYLAQMIMPKPAFEEIEKEKDENKDGKPDEEKETEIVYFNSKSFQLKECPVRQPITDPADVDSLAYIDDSDATVEKITDISRHIVIVFEAYRPKSSNDFVYEQFDYMMDKIVYDVKQLNGGKLPKINLIGHSRGGLTNMQYALEHPDLVDSIFSMGTPYEGSRFGQSEWILNALGMSKYKGNSDYTEGVADILDPIVFHAYRTQWNENYDKYYSHINFYPMAMEMTLDSLSVIVADDDYSVDNIALKVLIDAVIALSHFVPAQMNSLRVIFAGLADIIMEPPIKDANEVEAFIDICLNTLYMKMPGDCITGKWTIGDDLFIHTESAMAYEYTGIQPYLKRVKGYNVNLKKRAQANTAIPHNLETRDQDLINFIMNRIDLGHGEEEIYLTGEIDGGEELLSIIRPQLVGDILYIKSQVDGKTVTAIGNNALANNAAGQNLKHVVIPAAVTSIGNAAFENCTSLQSVVFEEGSQLKIIGDGAFEHCSALQTVALPNITLLTAAG